METYFINFINSIYINFYIFFKYIPVDFFNKTKLNFITSVLNFDFYINYYFFSIYLVFIIILTHFIYTLIYPLVCYLIFDLTYNTYSRIKHLKDFIIINKFENRFLYYYKNLFSINLKQFLVGTGIILFYLLSYFTFIISIEFFNNLNFVNNKIYNSYSYACFNNVNFFFQFNYINIFFLLILIYIFLHILFGLFNIFYDYLKDISFILFFLSFFIFFILFNLFLLYNNLELYLKLTSLFFLINL